MTATGKEKIAIYFFDENYILDHNLVFFLKKLPCFFYSFFIMAFVMEVVRDTDAILRICIILAQSRLLLLKLQKHGNTVALISVCSFQVFYLKKIGLSQKCG